MKPVILVRHAEPQMSPDLPATQWPLTDSGRTEASMLGARLATRSAASVVWTSPERRASETAALAFPSVAAAVRAQLCEIKKPWYDSSAEHAGAVARYLAGEAMEGWEARGDAIARLTALQVTFTSSESHVLVSHGLLLTAWLHHEVGLPDPFSFWTDLKMPDAWELNVTEKTLQRML